MPFPTVLLGSIPLAHDFIFEGACRARDVSSPKLSNWHSLDVRYHCIVASINWAKQSANMSVAMKNLERTQEQAIRQTQQSERCQCMVG